MLALASHGAHAQEAAPPAAAASGIPLRTSPTLRPMPRGEGAKQLPIIVQADKLSGRPDLDTRLEGNADFRRGGLVVDADLLTYDHPEDLAIARGQVRITQTDGTKIQANAQDGFLSMAGDELTIVAGNAALVS